MSPKAELARWSFNSAHYEGEEVSIPTAGRKKPLTDKVYDMITLAFDNHKYYFRHDKGLFSVSFIQSLAQPFSEAAGAFLKAT